MNFNLTVNLDVFYKEKIHWDELSKNPNAIELIKSNLNLINWVYLSKNPCAYDILMENKDKIDWYYFSENPSKEVIDYLEKNPDKIRFNMLNYNIIDEAIILLNKYPDKINWEFLSSNPSNEAIKILKKNPDKINQYQLCYNKNPEAIKLLDNKMINLSALATNPNAIDLIRDNIENIPLISYLYLYKNPSIFKLDYEKMRKNNEMLEEELLKVVLHPKRIIKNIELYGFDIDDMFD
jgi:hypothetical protein